MRAILLIFAGFLGLNLNLSAAERIVVGATPVPHAEILEFIKPALAKQGYELKIEEFNDYVQPNLATQSSDLDANFFQHKPYLEEFNKNNKTNLVSVAGIHLEPMGVYSKKYKKFDELKVGAIVAIPNDPTNESRALDILTEIGAIDSKKSILKTPVDITKNPKKLKFRELEAPQLPRTLSEVDVAIINSNYALAADLNPVKDSIALESKNSPYVNVLVVKQGNEKKSKIQALVKALQSPEVRKFIEDKYKGAVVPAF